MQMQIQFFTPSDLLQGKSEITNWLKKSRSIQLDFKMTKCLITTPGFQILTLKKIGVV